MSLTAQEQRSDISNGTARRFGPRERHAAVLNLCSKYTWACSVTTHFEKLRTLKILGLSQCTLKKKYFFFKVR